MDSAQVELALSGLDRHKATTDIPNYLINIASNLLSTPLTNFAITKTWEKINTKIKTLSYHKFKTEYKRILQSWTKMLRKMHVVCLILEYFHLKPGSLKILPPSPQKNNVEEWPEHFCCLLNNIDQGGVGGGVTMVPNSQGRSPVCRKEQNS